jgi:hypothetical protein
MSASPTTMTRRRMTSWPVLELATAAGLLGIAWIHFLDLADKMEETPYLGVAYIGLIAGCLAAVVLLVRRDRRGFVLGGTLAAATFLGYVLSRTTGLPAATDDIGNWTELLGVWSLVAEGAVVAFTAAALIRRPAVPSA